MAQFLFYTFEENSSTITNRGTGGSTYNGTSVLGTGTPPNANATNMWHMGGNNYPYIGPFSGNYAICVPNGSSNQNQTTHSWEIGLYKTGNGGLQKIWDKGTGAFAIQFMNDYLQVMRYSNNTGNQMYWGSSVTYPLGHYYYIQVSWNCGTPTSPGTPVVYVGRDGAAPSAVNMGAKQGSGAGSWNSDSASCANYGNYSTTPTTCPSTGGGYACQCDFQSIREYDSAISLPDNTRFYEDVARSTYGTPSAGKQIEILAWPTSPTTTMVNTGTAGTGYNGYAWPSVNHEVTAPDGSTAWKIDPTVSNECVYFNHNALINNWMNMSYTFSFYMNGYGTNGYNYLVVKYGATDLDQYLYIVTTPSGQIQLGRWTTNGNIEAWRTSNQVVWPGNWYTITVTWASGTAPGNTPAFYVDGSQIYEITRIATGTGYWFGDSNWSTIMGNRQSLDRPADITFLTYRAENQVVSAASAQAYYTTDSARFAQPTTITIETDTLSPSVYATVTLNGTLTGMSGNPPVGSTISIWHEDVNLQNGAIIGSTVTTDSSGAYTFDFIPSENGGAYFNQIGASYDGDASWQGCGSQNLVFSFITAVNQAITLTGQTLGCTSGVRPLSKITAGYSTTLAPTHVHGYSVAGTPLDVEVDYSAAIPVTHVHAVSVPGTTPVSVASSSTAHLPVEAAKTYGGVTVPHADYRAAPFTPIRATAHAIARTTIVTVSHIDQIFGILPKIAAYAKAIAGTDPTDVSRTDYTKTISSSHVHAGNIAGTQIVTVSHIDQILGLLPSVAVNAVGWGETDETSVVANSTGSLLSLHVHGISVAGTTPVRAIANYSKLLTTWAVKVDLTDIAVSTVCHTFVNSSWVACNANSNTTLISASKVDQILVAFTPLTATAEALASASQLSVTRRDQGVKLDPMDTTARAISGTQLVTVSHIDQILGLLPVVKANVVSIGATNDTDVSASSYGALDSNDVLAKAVAGTTPVKAVGHFSTLILPLDVHPDLTDVSVSTICNSTTTSSVVQANAISSTTVVTVSHIDQIYGTLPTVSAVTGQVTPTYRADHNLSIVTKLSALVNAISGTQLVAASHIDQVLALLYSIRANAVAVAATQPVHIARNDYNTALADPMSTAVTPTLVTLSVQSFSWIYLHLDVMQANVVTESETLPTRVTQCDHILTPLISTAAEGTALVIALSQVTQNFAHLAPIQVPVAPADINILRSDIYLHPMDPTSANVNAVSNTTVLNASRIDQILGYLPSISTPVNETTPTYAISAFNNVDSLALVSRPIPVGVYANYATALAGVIASGDLPTIGVIKTATATAPMSLSGIANDLASTTEVSVSHLDQVLGYLASLQVMSNAVASAVPTQVSRTDQNLPALDPVYADGNALANTQFIDVSRVDQILAIIGTVSANPNAIDPSVEVDFAGVTDNVIAEVTQLCDTLPTDVSVDHDALPASTTIRANAAVFGVSAETHTAALPSVSAKGYAIGNTTGVIVSHIDQVFASLFVLQAMANAIADTIPVHPSRVDKNVPAMASIRTLANAASGTSLVGVSHLTIVFVLAGPLYTDAVIRAQTKETWVRVDWAGVSPVMDAYVEATTPSYTLTCTKLLTSMVADVYYVAEVPIANAHTYAVTIVPITTYVEAVADSSPTHAYSYDNAYNRAVSSVISLVLPTSTHFDAELPCCQSDDIHSPVPLPVRIALKVHTSFHVS